MSKSPPLTPLIGETERGLRALLDRLLIEAGLSFPQWTMMVFLHFAGPLTRGELIARQLDGHIATEEEAAAAINRLTDSGLIAAAERSGPGADADLPYVLTDVGTAVFLPLREQVAEITDSLFEALPEADVEATRRTLAVIAGRAKSRLAAGHTPQAE